MLALFLAMGQMQSHPRGLHGVHILAQSLVEGLGGVAGGALRGVGHLETSVGFDFKRHIGFLVYLDDLAEVAFHFEFRLEVRWI